MNLPPGWLNDADVEELRRLAVGRTVLELGAWKGRSTVVLSEVARFVVSVDRHKGIEGHGESLEEYLQNVRELWDRNVATVIASFQDFVPHLGPFEMVFIDGDHDYEAVKRDIELSLLVEPELVAFHDYDFEDVRLAATEAFGEPDSLGGSVAAFWRV